MKIDSTNPVEIKLMQDIRAKWGGSIHTACLSSTVPEIFLAALVANESRGEENAKRFEGHVLLALWEVLMHRQPKYGSITFVQVANVVSTDGSTYPGMLTKLDGLATSWGLTQIMGYESIALGVGMPSLQTPTGNLQTALRMQAEFADHYGLDLAADFEKLFDCWNSGRPHAPTADPDYIPNGMARMKLYQDLLEEPPKSVSA
jgi:hypothetical protein